MQVANVFFSGINFFLKHLQLRAVLLIYICGSRQFCASKSAPRLAVKRYVQPYDNRN